MVDKTGLFPKYPWTVYCECILRDNTGRINLPMTGKMLHITPNGMLAQFDDFPDDITALIEKNELYVEVTIIPKDTTPIMFRAEIVYFGIVKGAFRPAIRITKIEQNHRKAFASLVESAKTKDQNKHPDRYAGPFSFRRLSRLFRGHNRNKVSQVLLVIVLVALFCVVYIYSIRQSPKHISNVRNSARNIIREVIREERDKMLEKSRQEPNELINTLDKEDLDKIKQHLKQ